MQSIKKKIATPFFVVLISLGIYFSFGFFHLAEFHTADEHYWLSDPNCGRIFQYWNAMEHGFWPKTLINDKPGVSLAYIAGAGLFFEKNFQKIFETNVTCSLGSVQDIMSTALHFRIPILLFNGFFCFYFFWILKKLFKNKWTAAWATSLILLSPVLLGISQIVNPDSLLWIFVSAAMLTFFVYLEELQVRYLVLTSVLTAFALLSKYSAIILFPYFICVILIHYIYELHLLDESFSIKIKKISFGYLAMCAGVATIFALLLPAIFFPQKDLVVGIETISGAKELLMFIVIALGFLLTDAFFLQSKMTFWILRVIVKYKKYILSIACSILLALIIFVLINWMSSSGILPDLLKVNFDEGLGVAFIEKNILYRAILELVPLVFSLQPFVLLSLLYLLVLAIRGKLLYAKITTYLIMFIGIFYAAVLYQNLLVDIRYSIMLYPVVMILSAMAIEDAVTRCRWLFKRKIIVSLVIILLSVVSLWQIKPFYFNYANQFLPKNRLIASAWGYGGYEAAQYLNKLPRAEKLIVWSDYNGFCQFFVGTCVKGNRDLEDFNEKADANLIDYYIKTRRGSILYKKIWNKIGLSEKDAKEKHPIWELNIDNRPGNYVKIYKSDNL
jgi:hypothetical protein